MSKIFMMTYETTDIVFADDENMLFHYYQKFGIQLMEIYIKSP